MRRFLARACVLALIFAPAIAFAQYRGTRVYDTNGDSYGAFTPVVVATPFTAGRGLAINCTGAGNITVALADGLTTATFAVAVGFQIIPISVINVSTWAGTGSIWNLP